MAQQITLTTRSLADQLERGFRGGAWHGPAVAEALEGVDADLAAARPIPDAHTIWEIVHHLTVWNEIPRLRIDGGGHRDLAEEQDWPPVETDAPERWEEAVAALEDAYRRLHARVLQLQDGQLDDPVAGSDPTVGGMLLGVVQHNAYHAGQIVLLQRAAGRRRERP